VKFCWQWNEIRKQGPHNLILFYAVSLKYYISYSAKPLLLQVHVTCRGARNLMIKLHTPHRYNRIVVFNHCVLYSPYNASAPSCWNTTSVSQPVADLEAASVQQFAENYISLCRERIRYQTGDHNLHHTYIIDIHFCKSLGRSLAQEVSCKRRIPLEAIRICGRQSDIGTGFHWVHTISPVGIIAPLLHIRTLSVTETK
jgi:hypothetical protein